MDGYPPMVPLHSEPVWFIVIDKLLEGIGRLMKPGVFNAISRGSFIAGNIAFLIAAVLFMILSVVGGVKSGQADITLAGIGISIAMLIGQFVSVKTVNSTLALVAASPSQLATRVVLNSTAAFALAATLGCLFLAVFLAYETRHFGWLLSGVAEAFVFILYLPLSLHPSLVNVSLTSELSADTEALGILAFFTKVGCRLSPIFFGTGSMAIVAILVTQCYSVAKRSSAWSADDVLAFMFDASDALNIWLAVIIWPVLIYIQFLIIYLVINVLRAILRPSGFRGAPPAELDIGSKL